MIKYFGSGITVELGDIVFYRSILSLWMKRRGYVSYLPGSSKRHGEMEYDQVKLLGVSGDDGTFRGIWIEPETDVVKKGVEFVSRSDKREEPGFLDAGEWL